MNTGGPGNWNNRWNNSGGFRGRGGRGNNWRGKPNYRGNHSNRGFRGGGGGGGHRQNFTSNKQNWEVQPKPPKREAPSKRLSEHEIGVTEYVSTHEGFLGIIKSRYSDFQVAEINERGEIAKLTDTTAPTPPDQVAVVAEDEDLLINKYNLEILPTETWDSINKLAMSEPNKEVVEIDVTEVSKEQRTKIHDAVKKAFGEIIVGSTVNVQDKKLIRIEKYQKGAKFDNRVKWVWPGEYVHFIVHKENCDTMDAAARIAERLRLNVKPSMLGYAGTKDRRAKTSQWFSMRKVDPRKISAACRDMNNIRVGNFSFRQHHIRLGQLSGNEFRIALRNVTVPNETINEACEYLKEKGFINYYGLQRFGTRVDIPTYQIGLKLLQGNLKEAINDILAVRSGPLGAALRAYQSSGAAGALRAWPRRANHLIEHRLLKALANCPTDLLGALDKLARNTRLLYLHSYQSLIWNRAASRRIQLYGLQPVPGDLVPLNVAVEEPVAEIDLMDDDDENSESNSEDKEATENGEAGKLLEPKTEPKSEDDDTERTEKREQQKIPVKVLTQEDIDSGKYSIFNIILPLPGYTIEYPPNMKQFYIDELAKDGLTLEMKHKFRSYWMSGAYRHVVVRPGAPHWELASYSEPTADLILSDWDRLQGRKLDGILPDGKYKALILTMNLPASCYATMALRELLKVDTSCDNQALQNNYYKKKETEDSKEDGEKKETEDSKGDIEKKEIENSKEDIEKKQDDKIETEDITEVKGTETSHTDSNQEILDKKDEILKDISEENRPEKRKIKNDSTEVEVKKLKEDKE